MLYIFEIKWWIILWNCIYNSEMKIFYAYYREIQFKFKFAYEFNLIKLFKNFSFVL